jgi:predicted nucleotidyltransferase
MASSTVVTAEPVIATLRAHTVELRQAGIRRVGLFGSLARADSDTIWSWSLIRSPGLD